MIPIRNHNPPASSSPTTSHIVLRRVFIVLAYLLAFIFLDSRSYALEVFPGIVAWYPPDGLSFALLLTFGAPFLPVFAIASLISSYFVFQLPQPFLVLTGWAGLISLAYGLAAWFLRRRARIDPQLGRTRDLFWMLLAAGIVCTLLATISVSVATANGDVPQAERLWATAHWWIGEMIGILVVTPVTLIHIMPLVKRFADGETLLKNISFSFRVPSASVILQALSIGASIYLAVFVSWPNDFHPIFLIAVPLIWIAIQHGLSGASIGNILVNFGITWAVLWHHRFDFTEIAQLQLLMLVITMTSLLIGSLVSEHKRSLQLPASDVTQRRKKIIYEFIVIAIVAMAAWILEDIFDLYEAVTEWEARNLVNGIDEALVTILAIAVASAIFSYRRWREVQTEIREREKAQAELRALYGELETRVQERTAALSKANELLQAEITERKQAEEALEQSEKRFRALIENSADAITLLDPNGVAVYDSPAAPGMLGYGPDALIGQNIFMLLHPNDLMYIQPLFQSLAETPGTRLKLNFRVRHKNGSWRWIEAVVTNLLTEPSVKAIVANYRDITDRKQAEDALSESDRRFRSLFENLPVSIWEEDFSDVKKYLDKLKNEIQSDFETYLTDHPEVASICADLVKILDANQASMELYDAKDKAELLGNLSKTFTQETYAAFRKELIAIWNGERRLEIDGAVQTLAGLRREVSIIWTVMPGHEENYSRVLVSLIDITERRIAEEASRRYAIELERRVEERTLDLSSMNTELEHANRVKDEFLTTMSHELRTPLNSILGLSESLLEQRPDPLSERQQTYLQTIEASGRHLLQLINDILDLSKIEAGMLDYYPEIITVEGFCRASLAFVKEAAVRKSITVTYQQELNGLKIYADPRRLKQILVNLLTNAVKFTPDQGQVILQVQADVEQDRVQFSVSDNGIGIDPQDLQKLFQPFVQLDTKLNRMQEGTGLGLTMVQKLTDLHGGSVNVESEKGKGSRFMINLPWGRKIIAQQEASLAGTMVSISEPASEANIASERPLDRGMILLAEDNLANILTIGDYLESHGYQIVVAHDGLEAIQKAEELQPNIILMDIQMPAMDGLEAISRLRTDARFKTTPIIALTALAMPGDEERCLLAGASQYMSKPVSLKLLAKTISQLLNQKM